MISTLIFVSTLVISLGYLFATRSGLQQNKVKTLTKPVLIVIIGILISAFQPFCLERVDAGSVGIKVNLTGDARGVSDYTYKNGWVVYNAWTETLHEFPTYQQHIEYDTLMVITKGGFATKIKPSFNYSLKSGNVGDMFINLRKPMSEIEQGWLLNAIVSSVNDIANRWTVDSVFNYREGFESSVIVECNKRISQWFTVSQLRTNIIPPPALQSAIINKTKAIQEAQAEDSRALTAEATGRKKVAEAKADSAFRVITASGKAQAVYVEAQGDAKAMKEKQAQLSPLYIEYIRATNWTGVYPTTMLGSGSNTLFNIK